jgi:valyl-tRNA synthetase
MTAELLRPMDSFFVALAKAHCKGLGAGLTMPAVPANVTVDGMQITVDLGQFIDIEAELARNQKQQENLEKQVQSKKGKLSNASFVDRAPAEVVDKERQSLLELEKQLSEAITAIERLSKLKEGKQG